MHYEHGTFLYAKFHSYVLTVYSNCVSWSFQFFLIFANSLMSSMHFRWLIFSCDLLSLYLAVHFLNMWLSVIMTIMNINGDSASPWNIPLLIFVSDKLIPPAVNCTLPVFMDFSVKFMTSCDILYIWGIFLKSLRNHFICLFAVNPGHS